MSETTTELPRRELALAALMAAILAVVMHWPLPLHLASHVSRDIGDPLVQAWQVSWDGHALLHQPLHFFQANQFYPLRDSLAFSDALVGYAPAGLLGHGVTGAIARYNVLFLFAYALAFFGAYLLAREFSLRPAAAVVAGAAFAYAPWRLEQDGHLHVLSSGGIPLALFLLLRGYRRNSAGMVLAGWAVTAWQLSIGITLGLQLVYLLGAIGIGLLVIAFWRRRRALAIWLPPRRVVVASAAGLALLGVVAIWLAAPYLQVVNDHPEAHRGVAELAGLSPPPAAFVSAPEHNMVWGEATAGGRASLTSVPEQTLFPGVAIVLLAIAGLLAPVLRRPVRIGLGVAVLVFALLSLGFHQHGVSSFYPYRLLYALAPGWSGVRAPGRINTLTSLALALLAAAGAQWLLARIHMRPRLGVRGARVAGVAVAALLVVAICLEGAGFKFAAAGEPLVAGVATPRVPPEPAPQAAVPAPRVDLPVTIAGNRRYVLWSANGFPALVNGRASFDPISFLALSYALRRFPDTATVRRLSALGVRSVVLHRDLAPGTAWADTATKSVAGLGITRRAAGKLLIYELPSAAPPLPRGAAY